MNQNEHIEDDFHIEAFKQARASQLIEQYDSLLKRMQRNKQQEIMEKLFYFFWREK